MSIDSTTTDFANEPPPPFTIDAGEQAALFSRVPQILARLFNNRWFHLLTLLLFALVLNREGTWVPAGNENVYFLYLWKAWHPAFLAGDWTFQETTAGHAFFNHLLGWPTRFISLVIFGWIGRFVSWYILFVALLRIGRRFKIAPGMVWLGVMLWLIQRQAFVAAEWIIGTFEAKCAGYACLLFAIDLIMEGRVILPAILTGLAFSFHSAIGLWGGAAIGLAFATQNPLRTTLKFAGWATLFALPGVITMLPLLRGAHASAEDGRFLVLVEMPFHLDPFIFGISKICTIYLMLAFNFLHYLTRRDDWQLRFLIRFQLFSGAFFLVGILCRAWGCFPLLELFPFRVFAVLIMLMFFWHLAACYREHSTRSWSATLLTGGVIIFLCLPSPVARFTALAHFQLPKWRPVQDDFPLAAKWVRENAPQDAVVIAPPWRKDGFYQLQRPLIANWHTPRLNAIGPWRERISALVGDVSAMNPEENLEGEMDPRARDFYANLTETDLANITRKYGGNLLITPSHYSYPLSYSAGIYNIYHLPPAR